MKNKKGFILAAVLFIIAAAIIVPVWLSGQKKEPDVPSETTAGYTEETVSATQETSAKNQTAEYMTAYKEYLENYNGGVYDNYFRFELVFFTNDDIPELFVSEDKAHFGPVKILTFINGEVVELYEGGAYGQLNYVERQSMVVEGDLHQGYVTGSIRKINLDGTQEILFSHYDNSGAVPPDSYELFYEINGVNVSEEEYNASVEKNMSIETSEFYDGIPMTEENIDKYFG